MWSVSGFASMSARSVASSKAGRVVRRRVEGERRPVLGERGQHHALVEAEVGVQIDLDGEEAVGEPGDAVHHEARPRPQDGGRASFARGRERLHQHRDHFVAARADDQLVGARAEPARQRVAELGGAPIGIAMKREGGDGVGDRTPRILRQRPGRLVRVELHRRRCRRHGVGLQLGEHRLEARQRALRLTHEARPPAATRAPRAPRTPLRSLARDRRSPRLRRPSRSR